MGDHITRGWFVISTGQVARLALGLVSSVLIARALGVADFGVFGVLAAVSAIGQVLVDMGLATTAVQRVGAVWHEDTAVAQQRARVFLWLRWLILALFIAIGMAFARPLAQFILGAPTPENLLWIRLALFGVAATIFSSSMTALLQATKQFQRINLVVLTNAGLTAVAALLLAAAGQLNLFTALLILGIGTAVVAFMVGYRLLPPPLDGRLPGRSFWGEEWPRFLRFGRWLGLSMILIVFTRQLDIILVNRWYAPAAVGAYVLALNLAAKLELLNHSQHIVLLPAAAPIKELAAARHFVGHSLRRNGLIALLTLPILWLIEPFIRIFYGAEFMTAVPLFRLLYFIVLFDFLVLPVTLLFLPSGQPKWLALADGVQLAVFLALAAWLIPAFGPLGAIAAKAGGRLLGFAVVVLALPMVARPFRMQATTDTEINR
jgi:O-antigen/teichoic acid export membrane protein